MIGRVVLYEIYLGFIGLRTASQETEFGSHFFCQQMGVE